MRSIMEKAVEWYRKAAEQGLPVAQNDLGALYAEGRGVSDEKKALEWFRKAAEQEYAPAQSNLGWMYGRGRGVQRNRDEAVKWLRKAAANGHDTKAALRELGASE